MPWPVNLHTHLRFEERMMELVVPRTAELYRYATAMPNLGKDRIRTPYQAIDYRNKILGIAHKENPRFDVNVPLYLEPDTSPDVVRRGFDVGAFIAAKLYPKNGTTNSAEGVDFRYLEELDPVFGTMEERGMLLLIHAEPQISDDGNEIDVFKREDEALRPLDHLRYRFPHLKIVFEHISTKKGADFVSAAGENIGATVAPQYLVWNRNELFRGGMNPAKYSIPVLKKESDRKELIRFAINSPRCFLGTDSAPHPGANKSKPHGCAGGVFNEPVSLFVYFQIFKESGYDDWFDRFVEFACFRGPRFYGLHLDEEDSVLIVEKPWEVPPVYTSDSTTVIPMLAGEQVQYSLVRIEK